MADKITDDELRKEILALGGEKIGPITSTTRSIYLKKLNQLRAKQTSAQKRPGRRKSAGRNLGSFSSEESDEDTGSLDRRARVSQSRGQKRTGAGLLSRTRREKTLPSPEAPPQQSRRSNSTRVSTGARKSFPRDTDSHGDRPGALGSQSQRRSLGRRSWISNHDNTEDVAGSAAASGSGLYLQTRRSGLHRDWPTSTRQLRSQDDSSQEDEDVLDQRYSDNFAPEQETMPDVDAFNSSDSDLEPGVNDKSDLSYDSPEMVSRSVNTSLALDSTMLSYDSSYAATPGRSAPSPSNSVPQSQRPNASQNNIPQQDSAYPMRQVPVYRTRRAYHEPTEQGFSHFVSTFLLVLAALFFAVLAFAYLQMASNYDFVEPGKPSVCSVFTKECF